MNPVSRNGLMEGTVMIQGVHLSKEDGVSGRKSVYFISGDSPRPFFISLSFGLSVPVKLMLFEPNKGFCNVFHFVHSQISEVRKVF